MNGREMSRQTSAKQTNAQTQTWQRKKQMVQSAGRRSLPRLQKRFKQQQQQRQRQHRLKNNLIFNLRISREFRFIQFVYAVRNIPNRICKTASKFEKEISKNGRCIFHVLSNMQNVAISRCCFVTFCKQRQRSLQTIITRAYTAIILVAVAVKVYIMKLPKPK